MREHEVYDALRRYLDAAILASVAEPHEEARRQADATEAQLAYMNALEAFHLGLRTRRTRDLPARQTTTRER